MSPTSTRIFFWLLLLVSFKGGLQTDVNSFKQSYKSAAACASVFKAFTEMYSPY